MKRLLMLSSLLLFGCSSIRYVTVDHGHIIDQNHQQINIVGNPPMICHYAGRSEVYSGYFEYQDDDGTIVLDHFGKSTIFLKGSPICELKLDTRIEE